MKTIQVNEKLVEAAREYKKYMETPLELTEEERAEYADSEPDLFTLLARFAYELAQATIESDGRTES